MSTTEKNNLPEGAATLELLELAEDIEDGLICLTALAHSDRDEYMDREYDNGIDYIVKKIRDDITSLRANLSYRLAMEKMQREITKQGQPNT